MKKVILFVAGCIIALLLSEFMCRFFLEKFVSQKQQKYSLNSDNESLVEDLRAHLGNPFDGNLEAPKAPHPYFGYVRPLTQENASIDENTLGFIEKPSLENFKNTDDIFVVGIFGGSVADRLNVTESENHFFVNYLKKRVPSLKTKNIKVLNFSYAGYRQPQQFIISSFYSEKIDVSINVDGVNEVMHALNPDFPVYYPLRTVSEIFYSGDVMKSYEVGSKIFFYYKLLFFLKSKETLRKSRWSLLRVIHHSATLLAKKRLIALTKEKHEMKSPFKSSAGISRETLVAERVDNWKKFLVKQNTFLSSQKVKTLFVLQPVPFLKDSKKITHDEAQLLELADQDQQAQLIEGYIQLRQTAKELQRYGLPIVDYTQIFASTEKSIYTDACCHMNVLGDQIVLEAIAADVAKILR